MASNSELRSTFFRIRVAVLLTILVGVIVYAIADVRRRNARRDWDHTLEVAIVVLRQGAVDAAAIEALRTRAPVLETRMIDEMRRYRPGALRPFAFRVIGPVDVAGPAPALQGDGILELVHHTFDLRKYVHDVDERGDVDDSAFDSRIYALVRAPKSAERNMVEGASEQGGRVGTVEVELDESMVDFALTVVTHELFHTLGATDKYDANGRTLRPSGLVEPNRSPLFPQPLLDVMARNRPIADAAEVPPESLDELAVGPATAREIGWTPLER